MKLKAKVLSGEYRYGNITIVELADHNDCPNSNGRWCGFCLEEGEGVDTCAMLGKCQEAHRCEYYNGVTDNTFGRFDHLDTLVSCSYKK